MTKLTASILDIRHDSVVDGPGLRSVVFFAGCPHACPGCHNPESWHRENGYVAEVDAIIKDLLSNPLTDITLSGGEPFSQAKAAVAIAQACQDAGKTIWLFTGWTVEELIEMDDPDQLELLYTADTIVDGRFDQNLIDPTPTFRGSTNQRILTNPFIRS